MFKPREMKRAFIVGSRQELGRTIELLHRMGVAHIIDYHAPEQGEGLQLGTPLENASKVSQQLLKLRSNAQLLDINPENPPVSTTIAESQITNDLELKIHDLELTVLQFTEDKKRLEDHLKKIDERLVQLQPFLDIDLPLDLYRGYAHLTVFTGSVKDIEHVTATLPSITDDYEIVYRGEVEPVLALFIAKAYAVQAEKLLVECGYTEMKLPEGTGLPRDYIERWIQQKQELTQKLDQTTKELLEYRKRHMEFVLASEEYLTMEVQKAEAPVRFATTAHSFIIDCWIPAHILHKTKEELEKETGGSLYVEDFPVKHDEEPPTLLENPKPVKRFEYLLEIYSIPNYRDVDPSFVLSLIFPLFFGLMVGDVGFGILLILVGYIFISKFKKSEGISNIGWYIIFAGIFSFIFGLFLFGDMFGLTFQAAPLEGTVAYSWSGLLGVSIPIPSLIHKMEALGLTKLLVLSIIIGFLHLGLGLLFGVMSEWKQSLKHAITKLGLLCILMSLTVLILVMADWTMGQFLKPLKETALAPILWGYLIPAVKTGVLFGQLLIPYVTIILGGLGVVVILVSTGGFGLIEVLEVTSHLISYTRLAAICVAKGAMSFAFNVIGLGMILSGNLIFAILGVVLLILLQLIVLALGSFSSGIQAVRLHYVEFFMKFYKGDGAKFTPFTYNRRYTTKN
jgi:V/A-type H+-transporting ATPase subunit I